MYYRLLIIGGLLSLAACAQNPPPPTTVRICDDRGCADRPTDQVAYDAKDVNKEDPRIAALKDGNDSNAYAYTRALLARLKEPSDEV